MYIVNDNKPCNHLEYKLPIAVLNSAVNPLVYAIFKRDIKNEFKRLYCLSVTNLSNDGFIKKKIELSKERNRSINQSLFGTVS